MKVEDYQDYLTQIGMKVEGEEESHEKIIQAIKGILVSMKAPVVAHEGDQAPSSWNNQSIQATSFRPVKR